MSAARRSRKASGLLHDAQADALETLARAGYVDDARFARDRAAHLAERGYGDEWIRMDLEAQGVAAEAAEPALAEVDPEAERAQREWVRLGGGLRAARTLARRGVSAETVETLVAKDPGTGVG